MEPTPMPVNLEPNVYAISGMRVIPTEEEFILQIISGNQMRQYSLTPKHTKRLLMLLTNNILEYEKQFGELLTELPTVPNQTEKKQFGFTDGNKEN